MDYKNNKELAKSNNKTISTKRIKIEHIFAKIKQFKILNNNFYHNISKINIFFKNIVKIIQLST